MTLARLYVCSDALFSPHTRSQTEKGSTQREGERMDPLDETLGGPAQVWKARVCVRGIDGAEMRSGPPDTRHHPLAGGGPVTLAQLASRIPIEV